MSAIAPTRPSLRLRFFFVAMACAVIITVFAGFAPTFYLRGSFAQTRPMSVLLHVHGVVFSAWVSFFLLQTLLIERGSRRLHQRLGWIGAGIAAAMVILVAAAVVEELRRVNGFPPPPLALALSAFDIIVFATLVGAALYYRKRPDWHKRFMLSATIVLLGAPMFRFVIHLIGRSDMARASIVSTLLVDAFFLPCFAYDLLTRRRIHPAYLVALALIVLDQVAQATVVSWTPWIDFSQALQRMVA
ncbi:MAG TPA: hypothetical protein VK743_04265 [Steroidobacteraceae bacterium]|jgi:hypothetical protein|nr:hypothetical protein [Steroidobacteraceae bacterium]